MTGADFGIDEVAIVDFCRRWKIKQLAVFGSAVRGGLGPDSDIDLLVTFTAEADWSMFDHYRMENELAELLARDVDLVSIRAIEENPNRIYRKEILDSAQVIYAA
ncbi:MAG: nucleotidyltransferase [Planctomycetes bacterium B3_Pla]|nr:MAG: nucleotidyltransferase [Planctomycetes bacterium B3_Pla]